MSKMGYVVGTGLGPDGEGRVDPVVAYVYPQGVSLGESSFFHLISLSVYFLWNLLHANVSEK